MIGKEGESNKNVGCVRFCIFIFIKIIFVRLCWMYFVCLLYDFLFIFYRKKNICGLLKLDYNNFEKLKNLVGLF